MNAFLIEMINFDVSKAFEDPEPVQMRIEFSESSSQVINGPLHLIFLVSFIFEVLLLLALLVGFKDGYG